MKQIFQFLFCYGLFCLVDCQHDTARLITMNTGLVHFLPNHDARLPALVDQLRHQPYDVACLQEVWYGNDVNFIIENTGDPFSFNPLMVPSSHPIVDRPCPFTILPMFWGCATQQWNNINDIGRCIMDSGILDLPECCIRCLLSGLTEGIPKCLPIFGSTPINRPGLLLLSKRPIRRARLVNFESDMITLLFRRAYIEADIEGIGPVICTHLTAKLETNYYEANLFHKYKSWEEQNYAEATRLIEATHHLNKVIIMGDINSGPGKLIPQLISAELPRSYLLFVRNRFSCPYVDTNSQCTVCDYNPVIPPGFKRNQILDHIFLRGHIAVLSERILDGLIPDAGIPVSDHYGIAVTIIVPPQMIYPPPGTQIAVPMIEEIAVPLLSMEVVGK